MIPQCKFDIVQVYPELTRYAKQGLRWSLGNLASNGITSIVDARCFWQRLDHEAWDEILAENELTVKAVLSMWMHPEALDDEAQMDMLKTFYTRGII
jgi:hypothetical protein